MAVLLFVAGLMFLIVGAEALVRGASRLAAALGVAPLIIGLTIVAFGTSSPELAVSVKSTVAGQTGIAVGNVVGSNIFNILLILGVSALITPLIVSQQLVRFDAPIMVGVSVLVLVLAYDGNVGRADGILLFSGLILYNLLLVYLSRKESRRVQDEYAREFGSKAGAASASWLKNSVMVIGGLALLVLGSRWLVDSAVTMARLIGVSELIIGLTVVAAGTSLPEVVTSVMASLKGERDIAIGNVIGSNLFNLMGVLGVAGIVAPRGIEVSQAALRFDIPVMIAASVACLPVFFTGYMIARWEGGLFLGYYVAYAVYLILSGSGHASLPAFSAVMLYFVIPLTALTLAVVTARETRRRVKARTG